MRCEGGPNLNSDGRDSLGGRPESGDNAGSIGGVPAVTARRGHSVFQESWWLDAVAPNAWTEIEVTRGGAIAARFPFVLRSRLGVSTIMNPPFTQTLGPWLATRDDISPGDLDLE